MFGQPPSLRKFLAGLYFSLQYALGFRQTERTTQSVRGAPKNSRGPISWSYFFNT